MSACVRVVSARTVRLRVARRYPALVLNADYTPLSYVPLSLWSWQVRFRGTSRLGRARGWHTIIRDLLEDGPWGAYLFLGGCLDGGTWVAS
eukprot:6172397-Pleurochrysis_carterae.AAC.2